ncbi:MAG: hypothetical protein PHS41_11430 [Victivallaceae bacterium]|nr:hypothetical protein [Victivallaceae bacterium]
MIAKYKNTAIADGTEPSSTAGFQDSGRCGTKFGKRLLLSAASIVLLALGVFAVVLAGHFLSLRDALPDKAGEVVITPDSGFEPGEKIEAKMELTLPVAAKIEAISVRCAEGMIISGTPKETTLERSLRKKKIAIRFFLRVMRAGEIKPGTLFYTVKLGGKEQKLEAAIPAMSLKLEKDAPKDSALAIAGEMDLRGRAKRYWLYWGAAALLLFALALLVWAIRRGRRDAALAMRITPEDEAFSELTEIKLQTLNGTLQPAQGFLRLTGTVRRFLTRALGLPALTCTTREFLDRAAASERLSGTQKPFLRNFLAIADLVKFAKGDVSGDQLLSAVDEAGKLVEDYRNEKATAEAAAKEMAPSPGKEA